MTDPAPREPRESTAIRIARTLRAPARAVFEARTSAELLRRWYPPGADWDTPVAEVELRVGGRLRVVMRSPTGDEFGGGEYREITPPTRLVFTWAWDRPELGGGTQLVEVDLTDQGDGTTTVVLTNRGLPDEQARESHRAGREGSFDDLDRALAR
jgi:uncharacterized protein YndB with AHSA1/START domain